jgi:hypothetical protein
MIEIDKIFKFEIVNLLYGYFDFKKWGLQICLFYNAFTPYKVEWFGHFKGFWVENKGLPPSAGSSQPTTKILPKTSLTYTKKHNLLDFETYWKSTCNMVWPTGSWQ